MKNRVLGSSGIEVTPLGYGCMGVSHAYGDALPADEARAVIRDAYDAGYRFFDTAPAYLGETADGQVSNNEVLVGEALDDVKDEVVIATKFGVSINPDRSLNISSKPDEIKATVESSLGYLGVDRIQLLYQHRIDRSTEPEVVAGTVSDLMDAGLVEAWGISEVDEEYLRRAHAVCPVAAIENRYSMMARWHASLFPTLEELDIAYVAFSPMANGFLGGHFDQNLNFAKGDYRGDMPQYTPEGVERAKELVEYLNALAEAKGATPAQISLAWMLCEKPYIIPIPGSRNPERMRENLAAADIVLTPQEVADINAQLDSMDLMVFGGHAGK